MDVVNQDPSEAIVNVVVDVVEQVKSRGNFDSLRRTCLTGLETDSAYYYLLQKVENFTARFLSKQRWHPQMNKSHLREQLREELTKAHFIQVGVHNIVEHIISKKRLHRELYPIIENLIYEHFDIQRPNKSTPNDPSKILRPMSSVTSQSTRLSNVHSYDSPSTSVNALLNNSVEVDGGANSDKLSRNDSNAVYKMITSDLLTSSRADDDTPVQDEPSHATVGHTAVKIETQDSCEEDADQDDDNERDEDADDEDENNETDCKRAEPSCSTTEKSSTKFERIDVDEGAELSVQCYVTQLTPERDETVVQDETSRTPPPDTDEYVDQKAVEEIYCETMVVDEQQSWSERLVEDCTTERKRSTSVSDESSVSGVKPETVPDTVDEALQAISDDTSPSSEYSPADIESNVKQTENVQVCNNRPRTRPSNKDKVGRWKHLGE